MSRDDHSETHVSCNSASTNRELRIGNGLNTVPLFCTVVPYAAKKQPFEKTIAQSLILLNHQSAVATNGARLQRCQASRVTLNRATIEGGP
jgi:hypothetical protein